MNFSHLLALNSDDGAVKVYSVTQKGYSLVCDISQLLLHQVEMEIEYEFIYRFEILFYFFYTSKHIHYSSLIVVIFSESSHKEETPSKKSKKNLLPIKDLKKKVHLLKTLCIFSLTTSTLNII